MTATRKRPKGRHFTFLIYPDSAPKDWKTLLELTDLPIAISPLHDMDEKEIKIEKVPSHIAKDLGLGDDVNDKYAYVNKEVMKRTDIPEKEYKKPHYHCIVVYNNTVTAEAVRDKLQRALGEDGKRAINKVQIIEKGIGSTYKYLSHESKDAIAKKKHKYNNKDIVCLNNFDIDRYVVLDIYEKEDLLDRVLKAIDRNGIENYKQLNNFMHQNGSEIGINSRKDLTTVIKSNIGMIRLALDGEYQERRREEEEQMLRKQQQTDNQWKSNR